MIKDSAKSRLFNQTPENKDSAKSINIDNNSL